METTLPTLDRHQFFRLVGTGLVILLLSRFVAGCSGDNTPPTPDGQQAVDFVVRLDDKANENLTIKGGYVIINNIIIAQTKAGQYVALSSQCTQDKTQLVYKPVENQFYCPKDLSRFDITGKVVAGPATKALTLYAVAVLTNSTLRVHTLP